MDRAHVVSLSHTMRNCLFVMLGSLCLAGAFSLVEAEGTIGALSRLAYGLSVLAFVGAIVAFYLPLGKLAKLFGRSVIVWVGLTLLFSPWGHVIAYFSMREIINKELARDLDASAHNKAP